MPSPFLPAPFMSSPLRNEIQFTFEDEDEELGQSAELTNETPRATISTSSVAQERPSAWLLSFTLRDDDEVDDDSDSDSSEEEDDDILPSALLCSALSELSDLLDDSDDEDGTSEEEDELFVTYDWVSDDELEADNEDGEAWDDAYLEQFPLVFPEEF